MYEPSLSTSWGATTWRHPFLRERRLVVGRYVWVEAGGFNSVTYRPEQVDERFEARPWQRVFPSAVETCSRLDDQSWLLNLDDDVASTFVSLPFCDEDQQRWVAREYRRWQTLQMACLMFLADKGSIEPDPSRPGGVHQRVVNERVTRSLVTQVRPLTDQERQRARRGEAVPSAEARASQVEVEEKQVSPSRRHARWQKWTVPSRYLYSQQLLGADLLYRERRLAIWFTMRTGKTALSLAVANRLRAEGQISILLVVCPKTNLYDPWLPEGELFGWPVSVLEGSPSEDEAAIAEVGDRGGLVVVNYERLGDRLEFMMEQWEWEEVAVVMDETSLIKNAQAQRSKAAHQVGKLPVAMLALLNGTPANQGPEDLWSQMHVLDPAGFRWGRTEKLHQDQWLCQYGPGKWGVQRALKTSYELLVATTSIRCVESEADQFSGKSGQFRFHALPAPPALVAQAKRMQAGWVELLQGGEGTMSTHLLALMGGLRELCCGYSKYKMGEEAGLPYYRERFEVDMKLLWVEAYLLAYPGQPVVFYCEFDEQEFMLIELLERLGHKWSGTREPGTKRRETVISCPLDDPKWDQCRGDLERQANEGTLDLPDWYSEDPAWQKYAPAVAWFEKTYWRLVTSEVRSVPGEKRNARRRAEATADFNEGRVQHYICKTTEAKGISLNRLPAVLRNESVFPDIISLAPPWSLVDWDQAMARCLVSDPRTNRSVCTPIHVLTIGSGSLETKVLGALRRKKDVQAELLQDGGRQGYVNFVHDLVAGLSESDASEAGLDEALAKVLLGIAPFVKLSEPMILSRLQDLRQLPSRKTAQEWLARQDLSPQVTFLSPGGRLLRPAPGEGLAEAASILLRSTAEAAVVQAAVAK